MLVFDSMETGPIMTNCYILGDSESKVAAVVDPGGHVGAIRSALERHELECKWIINTHAHFDHVGGNAELKKATSAEIVIHPAEAEALTHLSGHARLFGLSVEDSPRSISVVVEGEKKSLVGDLIFQGSIGRTDLPGGSFETLKKMADEKILVHPDDTDLYPGHGPPTNVGVEKRTNPFLTGEFM